jgi:hypothetical protein
VDEKVVVHASEVLAIVAADDVMSTVLDVPGQHIQSHSLGGSCIREPFEDGLRNAGGAIVAADAIPLQFREALAQRDLGDVSGELPMLGGWETHGCHGSKPSRVPVRLVREGKM